MLTRGALKRISSSTWNTSCSSVAGSRRGSERYFFDKIKKMIPASWSSAVAMTEKKPRADTATDALNQHIDKSINDAFGNKPGISGFLLKTVLKKVGSKLLQQAETTANEMEDILEMVEDSLAADSQARRMFGEDVQVLQVISLAKNEVNLFTNYTIMAQIAGSNGTGTVNVSVSIVDKRIELKQVKFTSASNPYQDYLVSSLSSSFSDNNDYSASHKNVSSSGNIKNSGSSTKKGRTIIDVGAKN